MNRTIRALIAVILVLVITFCSISIFQDVGKKVKVDITDQKLYTLSIGSKAILAKLNQPIKVKLYYAKTAALKGPDQIKFFNNYYQFVKSLLQEYADAAGGMFELEVIDPRPFSDEEAQALRFGLQRFPITEEENFFFGLAIQTQFGVEKTIPFFSPDRQNFVEYDISYLIDTAITREKKRIGILSSLPVVGDDVTGYMAQMMRMQGQQPKPAWTFVEQLKKQYEVTTVPTDVNEIADVDILLVIHPKVLPPQTLFAIDQFVLRGGRTIVCVDPHCIADQPDQMAMQMGQMPSQSSDMNVLLRSWGLSMPANTFAGDRQLAVRASLMRNQRPEKIIGFLELSPQCFNRDNVITTDLNEIKFLFAGVLERIDDPNKQIDHTVLISTTNRGNSWRISSPYELMMPDPSRLMKKFVDGSEPVVMGYLVTGKFKSSFPNGIEIEVESDEKEAEKVIKKVTGLTEAAQDCAVVVFSDVDFISDLLAYQNYFFGKMVVGDNSNLLLNSIEDLSGSTDLISIRSRGNFKRPFVVVDRIEAKAETETAAEEGRINLEIVRFRSELQSILASAKQGEEDMIGSTILQKKKQVELDIRKAQSQLDKIKLHRRRETERLGKFLQNANMLGAAIIILAISIVLGIRRSVRKRHYISHESDA
ncbi:Gldg family protein [Planctomycetota bacterium]